MLEIDINSINENDKNITTNLNKIKDFIDNDLNKEALIVILYGLAKSGKSTLMKQIITEYKNKMKCAFFEIEKGDTMRDISNKLEPYRKNGPWIICLDKITRASDLISSSGFLATVFGKDGMKIIASGYESLNFELASALFARNYWVDCNFSFVKCRQIYPELSVEEYIKGEFLGVNIPEYIQNAISKNIISGVQNYQGDYLKDMDEKELETLISKMIELYSTNRKVQNQVEWALRYMHVSWMPKRSNGHITLLNKFAKMLKSDLDRFKAITIREYLHNLGVFSTLRSHVFKAGKLIEIRNEAYVMPFIKHFYFDNLGENLRQMLTFEINEILKAAKLKEKLNKSKYEVYRAISASDEVLIVADTFCYYAFRVKFASKPLSDGVIRDAGIQSTLDKIYKAKLGEAVLYLGKSCDNGAAHFNIADFLLTLDTHKNIEIVFNELSKSLE